jgi:hypothetical protein
MSIGDSKMSNRKSFPSRKPKIYNIMPKFYFRGTGRGCLSPEDRA